MDLSFFKVEGIFFVLAKGLPANQRITISFFIGLLTFTLPPNVWAQQAEAGSFEPISKHEDRVSDEESEYKADRVLTAVFDPTLTPGFLSYEALPHMASAGDVLINEVVTDPQTDWSTNDFDGTDGAGTVSSGVDEWIELYIKTGGLDLTGWTIELNDGSDVTGDLTSSGAFQTSNYLSSGSGTFTNTEEGDYLVLGNVAGSSQMSNSITIVLKDASSNIIDQVVLGGGAGEAPDGGATDASNESVHRVTNGADTDVDDTDFAQGTATLGESNSEENTNPSFTSAPITSISDNETYSYKVTTSDDDGHEVTVTGTTLPGWLTAELATEYTVSTIAGSGDGNQGITDGPGEDALFQGPQDITMDSEGNFFIADRSGNRLRKMTPEGVVSTFVTFNSFDLPSYVTIADDGTIYTTNQTFSEILKVTPEGVSSVLAGQSYGYADGTGTSASFKNPSGLDIGPDGNIYLADYDDHRIRKITPAGVVTTFAGNGVGASTENADPLLASFDNPYDLVVDSEGNVYVADSNDRIAKIDGSTGEVTTFASQFNFNTLYGIDIDSQDNLYVISSSFKIFKITPEGVVSDVAGTGSFGYVDGEGSSAQFGVSGGIAVDANANIYFPDINGQSIRLAEVPSFKVSGDPSGQIGDHNVTLTATDGSGGSAIQSFTITVSDGTDPAFTSATSASVDEGTTDPVYTTAADDATTLTFSLGSGNDEGLFNIDTNTGEVTFKVAPDFENPLDANTDNDYVINVIATDANANTANQDVTITVDDVDEIAPQMTGLSQNSTTSLNVIFDEAVQVLGSNPTDFTVKDEDDNTYAISAIADGTPGDTQITLTVANFSTAFGELTVTYTNNNNEISDLAGNVLATDETGVTIDELGPFITQDIRLGLNPNANQVDIEFNEGLFSVNDGTGAVEVSDFSVVLSDNTEVDTPVITSITNTSGGALTGGESTIRFNFDYNGTALGDESLTFNPVADAVFDISGNAASSTQTNNVLQLHDETDPTITAIALGSTGTHNQDLTYYVDVDFSEGVHSVTVEDFEVTTSIAGPGLTYTATQTNGDALSGGETTVRLNLSFNVYGAYEGSAISVKVVSGTIFDEAGNDVPLFDQTTSETVDQVIPGIGLVAINSSNTVLSVNLTEEVYGDNGASLPLQANDFDLSVSGGTATGISIDNVFGPSDAVLIGGEQQIRIHISFTGNTNGDEVLTLDAANNTSIFDAKGNAMASPQGANNTTGINDVYGPLYTSGTTASFTENQNGTVYTATATDADAFTYGLGNSKDEDFFSIDANSGILTFNNSPDFENPQDANTDNVYEVEIIADDGSNTTSLTLQVTVSDIVDETGPTATITLDDSEVGVGDTPTLTIAFDEVVTGFTSDDLTVPNGSITEPSSEDGGQTYTATFTPIAETQDATNEIVLDMTGIVDGTGNTGSGTQKTDNFLLDTKSRTISYALTVSSAAESTGSFGLLLELSNESLFDVTVDYTVGGTASGSGVDHTLSDGTFTIPAGDTQKSLVVTGINDDEIVEQDETVIVDITNPVHATLGSVVSHTFSINNNDEATVSLHDISVNEDDGVQTLTATLDKEVYTGFTINVFTNSGTATFADGDFGPIIEPNQFVFEGHAGETRYVQIASTSDNKVEDDESFILIMVDGINNVPPSVDITDFATFTIVNDDQASVSVSDVTQTEGDAGNTTFNFEITVDAAVQGGFSVDADALVSGDAAEADATDFTPTSTTINFTGTEGEVQNFSVTIAGDAVVENDETFGVLIGNLDAGGKDVSISDGDAVGVITNDDAATVSINSVSGTESDSPTTPELEFTVTLNGATESGFSVDANSADGTATGNDYTSGGALTLNFTGTDGETQTYSTNISPDELVEGEETFTVTLSNLVANGLNISLGTSTGTGTIADDDAAPVFTSATTVSLEENNTSTGYTAAASDNDGGTITFSLGNSQDEAFFSIDENTGVLSFLVAPDFENPLDGNTDNEYDVEIHASDGDNGVSQNVTVTVTDLDEIPPVFTSGNTADFAENEEGSVYIAIATDASTVAYSLANSNDEEFFNIDVSTGELTFKSVPDFENPQDTDSNNSYVLVVKATDGESNESSLELTVTVTNLDEQSPVFTSGITANFDENSSGTVYTATATDDDSNSIRFSLGSDKDESAFSINANTGVLTFASPPDFENPTSETGSNNYEIDIKASDAADNEAILTLTVIVNDLDEDAPVFISASTTSFEENNEGTIYTAIATDAGTVSYSLGDSNDEEFFNLNATTGEITFKVTPDFENPQDADFNNSYVLMVKGTDDEGNVSVLELTVAVTGQNEDPAFNSNPVIEIDDNKIYNYEISVTDPDGDEVAVTSNTLPSWLQLLGENGVITFAGNGQSGTVDGNLLSSSFNIPNGIAEDSEGNLFVADLFNHTIRKIALDGQVTTFAGSGSVGSQDGTGTEASFNEPSDLVVDSQDNIFVVDRENDAIRKITPDGVVTFFVGGTEGYQDGTGTEAQLDRPTQIAIDDNDNLFITDQNNFRIRKITPAGVVTTVAGSGINGFQDGDASTAQFSQLTGIGVDGEGNVYVSDYDNRRIRKIDNSGNVTTLAGSDTRSVEDGLSSEASFYSPLGMDVDESGNIYVAEGARVIRKIEPSGEVLTIVGSAFDTGTDNGVGAEAKFTEPNNVFVDGDGNLLVTEGVVHLIRKVLINGFVLTGNPSGQSGSSSITLTADDGNGGTNQQSFTITINDVTAPVFTSTETTSFAENAPGTVYTAVAADAGTVTYSLGSSVDEEYFTIDSSTGVITFLSAPDFETPLDGDENNSYVLIVKATDNEGNESTLELMVTVTDVDEDRPIFTSAETTSFTENAEGTVYTAIAMDAGTVTYSLGTSVDEEYFNIDSNTGEINFKSSPDFENPQDGDANNRYVLIVKATDDEGNESTLELMVTVTDVDEDRPVFTSAETASFAENTQGTVYTAIATDAGTVTYSLGTSVDEEYFNIDSSTGEITFLSSPDFENPQDGDDNNSYVLIVTATDNVGNESTLELMVTVTDVDEDGPSVTITSVESDSTYQSYFDVTIVFDEGVIDFTAEDISATNASLNNFSTQSNSQYKVRVTPADQGLVTISVAGGVATDISNNENLPAEDFEIIYDSYDPSVVITSPGSLSSNYYPEYYTNLNPIPLRFEFSEPVYGFTASDLEANPGISVTNFSGSGNTYEAEVTTTNVSGTTVFVSLPGATITDGVGNGNGRYSIQLSYDNESPNVTSVSSDYADDLFGIGDQIEILIHFNEEIKVNGSPTLLLETGDEDRLATYVNSWRTGIRLSYTIQEGDFSDDLDYLSVNALSLNGGSLTDVAGNNSDLTLPEPGSLGSLSENKNLIVDAIAPMFTSTSSVEFTENAEGTVYKAAATDAGTITYSLANSNDEAFFDINSSTGELTFKTAPDFENPQDADLNNSYALVIEASDEAGNVSTHELTVTITDAEEDILEATLSIDDVSKAENADAGSTTAFIFTVTLSDNVSSSFTVDYGTGDNTATTTGSDFNSTSGTLTFAGTAGETQQITVIVNNDDILEADETFGVQLVNLQANGQSITIADDTGVGTITNDDQSTLSISDVTKVEGNSGTTDFTFAVTMTGSVDQQVTVDYATSDGTATIANGDYSSAFGILTFSGADGESRTITVTVNGDDIEESNESFTVSLSNIHDDGKGVEFLNSISTATGTITNDDDNTAPSGFSVSFDDSQISALEASNASFTFSGAEVGATFNYSVSSPGGGITVSGTGTITTGTDQVMLPDLSVLNDGALTLLVTLTDGSSNTSVGQESTSNLDTTGPTPVITSSSSGLIFTKKITATITFSENVSGFSIDHLSSTNSTLSEFKGSGKVYTVLMTAAADGEMTLSIPTGAMQDELGNESRASNTLLTKVEAFNGAPTDIKISATALTEKLPAGTAIGEFEVLDPDENDDHSLTLVSGTGSEDNNLFYIADNTLKSRFTIDYSTKQSASIRVRATDLRGSSIEEVISIEIVNVPEPRAHVAFVDPNGSGRLYSNFQFPKTRVGQESTVTMRLRNYGTDGDLVVSEINLPDGFEINESQLTVGQGEMKELVVTFKPTEDKAYSGQGALVSNSVHGSNLFIVGGTGAINRPPVAHDHSLRYIGLGRRIYLQGYDPDRDEIEYEVTESPTNGTFTTVSEDGRALDFNPSVELTPGVHRVEFKFKVVEAGDGLESEEASGEFDFYVQDTRHILDKLEIGNKTNESITFNLQFADEIVNSSYSLSLSAYEAFRRRFSTFYSDNSILKEEITLGQNFHGYQFTLEGSSFEKVTKSGRVSFMLRLRSDVGHSASLLVSIENTANSSEILVVDGGTDEGEFFVFGEEKSLLENESVEVDLYAVEFGSFALSGATIEITNPALYGNVGEPELVSNDGEIARWKVSYTSTSETERLDSIGFTVTHPTRSEQFRAYAVLDVGEVADEPSLSEIDDQQIEEDEKLTLQLEYSDPDSELSVSASSSDEDNISLSIENGELTVTPAQDFNGNVSIAVTVVESDNNEPLSVLQTFNLQVTAVNDKPVVVDLNDASVDEDKSIQIDLDAIDVDLDAQVFEFEAIADKPESVGFEIEANVLTITPATDFNGQLTFSVTADDGEGTSSSVSDPKTFVLTVNPVNDSPEVSRTISNQSVVEGLPAYTIDLSEYFTDPDVASSELTYSVSSVSNVSLSVQGTTLTIQSLNGAEGLETATITASDGELSVSQDVSFVASASSDQITVANTLNDLTLVEDFEVQVIDISNLFSYTSDANAVFTYQLSGNNNVNASINGTNLEISSLENVNGVDQLYIIGSTDGISAYTDLNISVSAVNDAPKLVTSISDASVQEDAGFTKVISSNAFDDVDGDALTYSASYNASWLSFDASTRTFIGTPENADVGSVEVTVTAEDPSGAKATDVFQIVVNNTNDNPSDIGISATALDENLSIGTTVATLSGTDPDVGDTNFTYSLVSGTGDTDNTSFQIVDGQLQTLTSVNFESKTSYSFRVKITDGFEGTFEKAFTISVNDVNEVATDISLPVTTLAENLGVGAVLDGLATLDPDQSDTHSYSLVSGTGDTDNASFTVVDGQLVSKVSFNFEEKSSYSVRLKSTDSGGLSLEKAFTITITNANDAPTGLTVSNLSLPENEAIGSEIGTLSTIDEDASDSFTYELVEGEGDANNSLFGLSGSKIVSKGSFNFESKDSYSVRVKSTDAGGSSVEETFVISIADANDAPTAISTTTLELAENEAIGTLIGQFSSTDEDTSDDHTYSLVAGEGDADNASFEFEGWNLKAKASFNFETKSTYNIRVQSSDGSGGTLESQFTVNVTNVLEVELRTESSITVPTISMGATETVDLVLNNDGEDELEITDITFPEGYSGSFTTATIAGGGSETLTITFEPIEAGTYAGDITITSNAGTNTVAITGEAEVVAGIENQTILPSQVRLYPNPASQFVEIDLTDLNGIPADLSVKSINGTAMWSLKEVRQTKVTVDISSYADGAYLILVQTDRGTVTKRLLIKK